MWYKNVYNSLSKYFYLNFEVAQGFTEYLSIFLGKKLKGLNAEFIMKTENGLMLDKQQKKGKWSFKTFVSKWRFFLSGFIKRWYKEDVKVISCI